MAAVPVLIVGAGPTGLVLALWLTKAGVPLRIIDHASDPGTTSRAVAVQARTLEFYRQLGTADEVIEAGLPFAAANLWGQGRRAGRVAFGDMGQGFSLFPYMLIYPQDEHERLLTAHLSALGVEVERRTELTGFEQSSDCVRARLTCSDATEEICEAAYLAGCDGAHSAVRLTLPVDFVGGTYPHLFYVADVEGSGPAMNGELNGTLDTVDFLALFPLKGNGRARLIGTVRESDLSAGQKLTWEDANKRMLAFLKLKIDRVNWFSTYHVHHRVATRFRVGRVFLLGDAAHVHSPVGGQGMNTGIGDAVNLAWKLAEVLHGRADAVLLDSYEPERIAFARKLVATTDTAFELITRPGPILARARLLAPRLLAMLFRLKLVRRLMFLTISQTAVNYRRSPLSQGRAGRVQGGDRLPWLAPDMCAGGQDNFAALGSRDWQVHVYGELKAALIALCQARDLTLHRFPWRPTMRRTGLKRDAIYLVRPDGYVALTAPRDSAARLERYLEATFGRGPRCR
jgi:2-polyprenyl-6-methoxyphenol hydroxylase-like FAD-dependent oxidoreductase